MLIDKVASHNTIPSVAVAQEAAISQTFVIIHPYYTQGKVVTVGGMIFLIAYHWAAVQEGTVGLTPDTVLTLSLINLRQIASLVDIQPYVPQTAAEAARLQQEAAEDASIANPKQIGLAMTQYEEDNDEKLPPMQSASAAKTAISPYVKSDAVIEQPQTHEPYQPNTSLSHRTLASFADPNAMVLYYEPYSVPDGKRAVLFVDGHVYRISEAEWQRLKVASHVSKPTMQVQ